MYVIPLVLLKFIYSEKATKFCKISNLDLSYVVTVKCKVEISQNFVAFSEYMNFSFIEKSDPSLYNLKMTCKQFSNMVRSEQIDEKRREENRKVKIFWERQPFPYIEAYRSYYSLYLPLE